MTLHDLLAPLALVVLPANACAGDRDGLYRATIAQPVEVPLVADFTQRGGQTFVDIAVRSFVPSRTGPVEIVVDAVTGRHRFEVGRFGLYPERAFVAQPQQARRFTLKLPPTAHLDATTRLFVRLVPGSGSGDGASIEVEAGRLRRD